MFGFKKGKVKGMKGTVSCPIVYVKGQLVSSHSLPTVGAKDDTESDKPEIFAGFFLDKGTGRPITVDVADSKEALDIGDRIYSLQVNDDDNLYMLIDDGSNIKHACTLHATTKEELRKYYMLEAAWRTNVINLFDGVW